jgi:hypothetical protein
MKNYWKIDTLEELIKIESNRNENIKLEMPYIEYLKTQIKLMKEAQKFGEKIKK